MDEIKGELIQFLENISERLRAGDARLGLPAGTLDQMSHDPDYLMIIKMIAAIEPTVNELILAGLARPVGLGGNTREMFSGVAEFAIRKLQLNGRGNKLDFAESLGVLNAEDKTFIDALSQIRNRYAHNIRNVSKSLKEMLAEATRSDNNFGVKLFRMRLDFAQFENGGFKMVLLDSFSILIENAERTHQPLHGLLGGVLSWSPSAAS